jgi:hypothetical protein
MSHCPLHPFIQRVDLNGGKKSIFALEDEDEGAGEEEMDDQEECKSKTQ